MGGRSWSNQTFFAPIVTCYQTSNPLQRERKSSCLINWAIKSYQNGAVRTLGAVAGSDFASKAVVLVHGAATSLQ
ncbi:hypothetical protein V2J09_000745 [Rumex salicifolius]